MRSIILATAMILATGASAAAQPPPATGAQAAAPATTAPAGAHYSAETTDLGTLLDDPASKAVLMKEIPTLVSNPQIDMARGMTLKDLQQYSPDLTDSELAKIDTELAALPQKK